MSDSRGPEIQAVVLFLLVLCLVTVGLRCYTMKFIVGRFAVEDWLAVAALVLYVVFTAFAMLSVQHGLGRHLSDVAPTDRSIAFMWRHFCTIVYIVISALTKFVVGLFLLRLCSHIRWMRVTIRGMLVVVGLFYTFYFFVDIFPAKPINYYWLRYAPNPPEGRENDPAWATIPTIVGSVLNIIVDWMLAILPMILLWNARLDRRTKISVCGVLAVGSIASVATIVRLVFAKALLENSDYLYNFADFGIWSTVEIGLALSASSLGTLRPLMRKFKFLSGTDVPVVTHFSDPYPGGRGAGPDAKAPGGAAEGRGRAGSSTSKATTAEVPYELGLGRAAVMEWRDLEAGSKSGIAMVDIQLS